MSEAPEVLCRTERRVGRITLNRPAALHALTTNMVRLMTDALVAWRDNPAVELILIDHSGDRGFCAGGDIRMLAESGAGDGVKAREFLYLEYQLNHLLFHYPKPSVAIMDGVTMGGGVGLAMPCRYRVATERTTFSMPETGIGLFPDVGGGWYLSRMPNGIGVWLALTGARIGAADCIVAGIATDSLPSARIPDLKQTILERPDHFEVALAKWECHPEPGVLADRLCEIRTGFAGDTLKELTRNLECGTAWLREQLKIIRRKSPQATKVTFRQLQRGARARTFAANMLVEYRLATRLVRSHDFLEGVRAVIVDKDNTPDWRPPSLGDVEEDQLDLIFSALPRAQEWSPLPELVS